MAAVNDIREEQNELLDIFEGIQNQNSFSDNVPVIAPSIRWAQSKDPYDKVMLEIQFSTRIDSPACLDLSNKQIRLENNKTLVVEAMCKADNKILKYSLRAELFGEVEDFATERQ